MFSSASIASRQVVRATLEGESPNNDCYSACCCGTLFQLEPRGMADMRGTAPRIELSPCTKYKDYMMTIDIYGKASFTDHCRVTRRISMPRTPLCQIERYIHKTE